MNRDFYMLDRVEKTHEVFYVFLLAKTHEVFYVFLLTRSEQNGSKFKHFIYVLRVFFKINS